MNGNVFQCFTENETKNQFNKTVEALGEYVAKNMKYAGDMMQLTKETSATGDRGAGGAQRQ